MAEVMSMAEIHRLIADIRPALLAFAWSITRDAADAEDVTQEACTKILVALQKGLFEPGSNFKAWSFTIARNAWYTMHSKKNRMPLSDDLGLTYERTEEARQESDHEYAEMVKFLFSPAFAVEKREALVKVFFEGKSYDEAAAELGVAVGTVKSRVNRARAALIKLLEPRRVTKEGTSVR